MPIYKVDIETNFFGEYITNVFHIEADSIAECTTHGIDVANLMATLNPSGVVIDKVRVSTPAPDDNVFNTTPVSIAGTRTGSVALVPPFNRFRVDMSIGFRRPLRKYLLTPYQVDINGGAFTGTAQTYVNTNFCAPLLALGFVVSAEGLPILSAVCRERVGMRQLRRGSRRRTTPVI